MFGLFFNTGCGECDSAEELICVSDNKETLKKELKRLNDLGLKAAAHNNKRYNEHLLLVDKFRKDAMELILSCKERWKNPYHSEGLWLDNASNPIEQERWEQLVEGYIGVGVWGRNLCQLKYNDRFLVVLPKEVYEQCVAMEELIYEPMKRTKIDYNGRFSNIKDFIIRKIKEI